MATVELSGTDPEGPGHQLDPRDVTETAATAFDTVPTTPTNPIALDTLIPQVQRRLLRAREPTERILTQEHGSKVVFWLVPH